MGEGRKVERHWPFAVLGGFIGVVIAGYPLVYLPMSANHAKCGKVTLCPKPIEDDPEYWRRAMCTQHKYQHLRVCTTGGHNAD